MITLLDVELPLSRPITATNFADVLARLGIRDPEPFELSETVSPVAVVDADLDLRVVTPPLGVSFSGGELVAPADLAVMADTLDQAAGDYFLLVIISNGDTAANAYRVQRRDAANAANIWSQHIQQPAASNVRLFEQRVTLAQGERIRIQKAGAGGAGTTHQASIWLTAAL